MRKHTDIADTVAIIHGVTSHYVRMVRRGDRKSAAILETIARVEQEHKDLIERQKRILEQA